MLNIKAYIELFHIMFLRQFSSQIDAKLYAIKGGCNLRFFFNSVRYSEDLDLDICVIQQQTLENKVNKILTTPPLLKLLQAYDILQIDVTSPEQTQTTQRWKIQLHIENAEIPFNTKIKFSRRNEVIQPKFENISIKICQTYRLPPIRLSHYGLSDAVEQKILALAHRNLTQARDIFDLYHLLHIGATKLAISLNKKDLGKAEEALLTIDFNDYKSQVVNFLEIEEQKVYDTEDYWNTIINEVLNFLNGLVK